MMTPRDWSWGDVIFDWMIAGVLTILFGALLFVLYVAYMGTI